MFVAKRLNNFRKIWLAFRLSKHRVDFSQMFGFVAFFWQIKRNISRELQGWIYMDLTPPQFCSTDFAETWVWYLNKVNKNWFQKFNINITAKSIFGCDFVKKLWLNKTLMSVKLLFPVNFVAKWKLSVFPRSVYCNRLKPK